MHGRNGSSLPGLLSGLTVLILTGVGLSVLMERRLHSSGDNRKIREEIQANELAIGSLRSWRTRLEHEFDTGGRAALTFTNDLRRTAAAVRENGPRLAKLRLRAEDLRNQCGELAASFDRYRVASRNRVRNQAAGEKIGALELANGRRFTGVSIVHVTDDAMEIVHDAGRARIAAKDLAPSWRARFQWEE